MIRDENGNFKNVFNFIIYMDIFIFVENGVVELFYYLIIKGDMLVLKLNVINNMSVIYVWVIFVYNNIMIKVFCKKGF